MQQADPSGAGKAQPGAEGTDDKAEPFKAHEAILHTLDRWIVTPDGGRVFIPADEFSKSVNAWDGVPLVFAKDHPDPELFIRDPKAALAKVQGRPAGELRAPRVAMEGSPRFMALLDWGNDAQIEGLWRKHKLSSSVCYFSKGRDAGGRSVGPMTPNHVLLFELSDEDLPRDPGVFILNKSRTEDESMTIGAGEQDEAVGLLDRLKAVVMKRVPAGASSGGPAGEGRQEEMSEEEKQKLASASKELEEYKAKLASKDAEVKGMGDEISKLKGDLDAFHKKAKDDKWVAMRAKCPPGLVHGEKEAEMRVLYEGDKDAFYERLLSFKQATPGKEEGAQFMVKGKGEEDVDARLAKYATQVMFEEK